MGLKFRRGTTAQKSGSLAFGEPYVNTELNTLQIGGASGDITLGTSTGGNYAGFGANTFTGDQSITGSLGVTGNITLGGNLQIGDQTTDTVQVVASLSSSLIPSATNTFDLGSATKIWKDLYISTGSIKFVEGNSVVKTLSAATLTALEATTGSSNVSITNLNTATASLNTSVSNLNTFSGSANTRFTEIGVVSGSLITSASAAKTTNDSQGVSITNINLTTASLNTSVANLNSFSSSQLTQNSALATISGSLISSASANTISVANLNAASSSYETKGRSIVSGSSQITYTSISSIPAGIISGSSQLSGTSITDLTITNLTVINETASVIFSSGSNRFGDFGDDTHSFTGSVKISGSITTIGTSTATSFNGTINATNGVVSGSAQIDHNATTNYVANRHIDHTAVSISAGNGLSGGGDISATRTLTLDTTSATFTTGVTTQNNVLAVVSGSRTITIGSTSTTLGGTSTTLAGLTSVTSTAFVGALTGNASTVTTNANLTGNVTSVGNTTTIASGVVTSDMIVDGTIVNGDINASAAIVDTKLATISTAGKVSNSATTAASANTLSAIVARDASGNFSAGTITAALSGNATTATTLQTTRAINGVNFDGSAAITVTAAAGTLSGATLASGVTASSLTSVGTLGTLTVTGATATGALTVTGAVTATGDITAFFTSDKRHKNNIQTISNAVLKVKQLNGVTWEWNDDVNEVTKTTPKTGLIAQEVQQVLPEVVKTRDDGFLALDYSKMMGLMVEAIKEQQIQIEQLKAKIGL